jgi:MFS family permease
LNNRSEVDVNTQAIPTSDLASAPSTQRWFVVGILSIASMVSYIDRQVINLLVEPIKIDLGLTDVQISLLQGFSFALLYAVLAIPLAWIADRHNRKWVILVGIICWSAATFMSGIAATFAMLFFARMMVGIGEATLAPAGFSIISDYFNKRGLPAAISVFTGSGFVGSGLALIIGGYLLTQLASSGDVVLPFGTFKPWQATFMCLSLFSIPVFLLVLMIREPVRRDDNVVIAADAAPPVWEIIQFIKDKANIFLPLFLGFSCFAAAQFGIGAWAASYFIRVHGWSQLEVGEYFGPVVMLAGIGGVVTGGLIAEWMLKRGISDATLRVPLLAVFLALPLAVAFPLMASPFVSLALLAIVMFLGTMPFGAGVSTFPLITPNRMRAQVVAVYLLIANLLGYSAGPIFIAALTDKVFADPARIHHSLAIAPPLTMLFGILLVLLAIKPYRRLLENGVSDGVS